MFHKFIPFLFVYINISIFTQGLVIFSIFIKLLQNIALTVLFLSWCNFFISLSNVFFCSHFPIVFKKNYYTFYLTLTWLFSCFTFLITIILPAVCSITLLNLFFLRYPSLFFNCSVTKSIICLLVEVIVFFF